MEKKETLELIRLITVYYPNFKFGNDQKEQMDTLTAWYGILRDCDVMEISKNLIDYVKTGATYPPVVGQLLSKPKEMRTIPNVEETRIMIEQWNKETEERQKMLQAPGQREAIEKMQADFRKKMGFPPKKAKE